MKLLTLFFKNINSLEGESLIDFQKKPLLKGGVFAITGPNGSGKSSILDALSLAFYGETFRFDRPADYVMTHNAVETFAQVEFSLDGKKYRSRWQVNRQNNQTDGALSDPIMQLFSMDGDETLLESSVGDVSTKISDIMGMDFHNFSRSILLAQGDFSAFLNALDNERMDILEKMSSQDIYAEHKQQLSTKKQQSEQALNQIKTDLNTLPDSSEVSIEASEQDLADFESQIIAFTQQQQQINAQLEQQQQIETLAQKITVVEQKQNSYQNSIEQTQQKLQRIKELKPATEFKNAVNNIEAQQQITKQCQSTLRNHQHESRQLTEKQQRLPQTQVKAIHVKDIDPGEQKQVIDELRYQVKQKNVDLKTEKSSISLIDKDIATKKLQQTKVEQWLDTHSGNETLLEGFPETQKLQQLTQNVQTLTSQCSAVEKKTIEVQAILEKTQIKEADKAAEVLLIKQDLAEVESTLSLMKEESPLFERQHRLEQQQQRTQNFKELQALAKVNHRVTKSNFLSFFSTKKTVDESEQVEALTEQASLLTQQISETQFLRNTLEKAIINEQLLQKMQQQRTHLETDKPCPLCGSVDHPFAKKPPRATDSQQALKEQSFKLKNLVSQADKIKNQIFNTEKKKLKNIDKSQSIQKNQSHWHILSNKLNVAGNGMGMDNFELMKKLLKQEETEFKEAKKQVTLFEKQQAVIKKLTSSLSYQSDQGKRLKEELNQQTTQVAQLPQQLEQLKTQLEQVSSDEKTLSTKTLAQLEILGEKMPIQGQDEVLKQRLQTQAQDYKNYQQQRQSIKKSLSILEEKRLVYRQKVKQLSDNIEQNSTVLAKEEVVGLLLSQVEKQDSILEEKQLLEAETQKNKVLEQTLTEQLHQSPFASISDVKEALVLIEEETSVAKKHADFQQQAAYLETEHQQLQVKLAEKKSQAYSEDKLETLALQEQSLTEKISIAKAEVRTLKNKQQQQQSAHQRRSQLNEKLEQQQQKFTKASENLQQSQENGVVFRRRVQLKMATQLLSQTNAILEKISGRYYLRQAPSDNGLALEIEDTKQQNSRLSPESLSGGERFVISLALALGLSELANNGKSVDFLFLDEGFGNLDSESLYTVISTLQNLQTQGKTVGVISHVDGIKKRIKTRIEMVKKPNGLSKLKKIA